MPEGYEKLRDKFIKDGMNEKEAKKKAVRIWNAQNPDNPVTKTHEDFRHLDLEGIEDDRPIKLL